MFRGKLRGLWAAAACAVCGLTCTVPSVLGPGGGDADTTTLRVIRGLEFYSENGCAACHCNNGQGGCNLNAPNIQGMTNARVDLKLRAPQSVELHPLKMDDMSDESVDDLSLFLDTLTGREPIHGTSAVTRGYNLYIQGECIVCHLSSAQGNNQGGIGVPIAGTDPDNIYQALVNTPCHPRQRHVPTEPGAQCRYPITTNDVVQALTDTPAPGTDDERTLLGYFLTFIAPPPSGGVVEKCDHASGEVCTVAGNGIPGFTRDNVPATETLVYSPIEVELTDWNQDGTLDLGLVDWNNHRVRMIFIDKETEGVKNRIISLAGTGKVTGTDAINHCSDLAFDDQGGLVMANWHNQNMYRYPRDITDGSDRHQLAGLCDLICSEDSAGPTRADETFLALPVSLAIHPDGRIFFTEGGCSRLRVLTVGETIRRQKPTQCITEVNLAEDGLIETFAGRLGVNGYEGDGGPVSEAIFNIDNLPLSPNFGIQFSPENPPRRLYIADSLNNCIRYIDMTVEPPTIHLFAGVPTTAGFQDGAAKEALFNFPTIVDVDAAGNVYVADSRNHRIRRIDPDGREVTTIIGTGVAGYNGDNRQALQTQINYPGGVAVHPDGRIFFCDLGNNRVRVVNP